MGINEVHPFYSETLKGVLCLLNKVHNIDPKSSIPKSTDLSNKPCEVLQRYIESSFLGEYFIQRKTRPVFLHNATNLFTFIRYLAKIDSSDTPLVALKNQQDILCLHIPPQRIIQLKLLSYVTFIEADEPMILIGNCLNFLKQHLTKVNFNFSIYHNKQYAYNSAYEKYLAISNQIKDLKGNTEYQTELKDFYAFIEKLKKTVLDRELRNSIAHNTYRIEKADAAVKIYTKSGEKSYGFSKIEELYENSFAYIEGFRKAVECFAKNIVPCCPYPIDWGPKW